MNRRKDNSLTMFNYRKDEPTMIIEHRNNQCIIDDEDAELARRYKWRKDTSTGYWATYIRVDGCKKKLYLHRLITKNDTSNPTDHINHNKDDNRRENLRIVSYALNARNRSVKSNNQTGYTNIFKEGKKYVIQARINGKTSRLGRFNTIPEALQAKADIWMDRWGIDLYDEIEKEMSEAE